MALSQKFGYEDHVKRENLLLDELARVNEELVVCAELMDTQPSEVVAAEYAAEVAIRAATEMGSRLHRIQLYVDSCKAHNGPPTLWELEMLMRAEA